MGKGKKVSRALGAAAVAAGVLAYVASPAGAIVSNPGPITATGSVTLTTAAAVLGPIPLSLSGSVSGGGTITVPSASLDIPPFNTVVPITGIGDVDISIDINATSDWTGVVDPDAETIAVGGDAAISLTTGGAYTGVLVNCPLPTVALGFTGEYDPTTGATSNLTEPSFSMDAIPTGAAGCNGVEGLVNSNLGLPNPAAGPVTMALTISPLLEGEPEVIEGAPTANGDSASVNQGQSVLIDVLANDTPAAQAPIDPSSLEVIATPGKGTAVVENGQIRYTANAGATGADSFNYQVCSEILDGEDPLCDPASVTITIVSPDAPVTPGTTPTTVAPAATTTTTVATLPATGASSSWLAIAGALAVLGGAVLIFRFRSKSSRFVA